MRKGQQKSVSEARQESCLIDELSLRSGSPQSMLWHGPHEHGRAKIPCVMWKGLSDRRERAAGRGACVCNAEHVKSPGELLFAAKAH